jgi:uncharacterized protein YbaP (TraB family)
VEDREGGLEPSYLFGTMHMTDPRVTALTPRRRRPSTLSTVVIETTDVLDQAKMAARSSRSPN